MRRACTECGRPIVAAHKTRPKRARISAPSKDHDLCMRCWRAERERAHANKRKEAM
jgi:hypothetical protein